MLLVFGVPSSVNTGTPENMTLYNAHIIKMKQKHWEMSQWSYLWSHSIFRICFAIITEQMCHRLHTGELSMNVDVDVVQSLTRNIYTSLICPDGHKNVFA